MAESRKRVVAAHVQAAIAAGQAKMQSQAGTPTRPVSAAAHVQAAVSSNQPVKVAAHVHHAVTTPQPLPKRTAQAKLPGPPQAGSPTAPHVQRALFQAGVGSAASSPIQCMQHADTSTWGGHQRDLRKGADRLALFSPGHTGSKATAPVDRYGVPGIQDRADQEIVKLSLEFIEHASYTAKTLPARTEVIGEAVALIGMLGKKECELALPVRPGHGAGVDQVWCKKVGGKVTEWLIVEAKGPGATLTTSFEGVEQMSQEWVESRIDRMTRSGDPDHKAVGLKIKAALSSGNPPVRGLVVTATKKGPDFGRSQGRYRDYS